jgi:hypothetical protein
MGYICVWAESTFIVHVELFTQRLMLEAVLRCQNLEGGRQAGQFVVGSLNSCTNHGRYPHATHIHGTWFAAAHHFLGGLVGERDRQDAQVTPDPFAAARCVL